MGGEELFAPVPGQVGHVRPQSRQVVDSITVLPADRQGLTEVWTILSQSHFVPLRALPALIKVPLLLNPLQISPLKKPPLSLSLSQESLLLLPPPPTTTLSTIKEFSSEREVPRLLLTSFASTPGLVCIFTRPLLPPY